METFKDEKRVCKKVCSLKTRIQWIQLCRFIKDMKSAFEESPDITLDVLEELVMMQATSIQDACVKLINLLPLVKPKAIYQISIMRKFVDTCFAEISLAIRPTFQPKLFLRYIEDLLKSQDTVEQMNFMIYVFSNPSLCFQLF